MKLSTVITIYKASHYTTVVQLPPSSFFIMSIFIAISMAFGAAANDILQRLVLSHDSEALFLEAGPYFASTSIILNSAGKSQGKELRPSKCHFKKRQPVCLTSEDYLPATLKVSACSKCVIPLPKENSVCLYM